jgi:hypothetical protein
MINYGGTAKSAEQVKATILETTCDPGAISRQYDSYFNLMPYAETDPTTRASGNKTSGKFFAYRPVGAEFIQYRPDWSAKGYANSYSYRSDDLPGGTYHVSSKGSIEKSLMDSYEYGGIPESLVHNICSYYVWYLFRTNEVHSDLKPYYSGDIYRPTLQGVTDAELKWVNAQREKFIANVAMKELIGIVNQMRMNPPSLSQKGQITSWLTQQVAQTTAEDNADWSDALGEVEGVGDSEKEEEASSSGSKSILPQVAVASVLAIGTFALLNRRGA